MAWRFAWGRRALTSTSAWKRPRFLPRRGHDSSSASVARPRRLGGLDRLGDLGDRALRHRGDQHFAGREVDVDRGPHHARPASDLGHAGLGIARQRVEGTVEDALDAALRVGSSGRAGAASVDGNGRREPELRRKLAAEGRIASARTLATAARAPAARNASPMPLASSAAGGAERPGRDRGEDGDAERPADLVARGVEAGEHPGLLVSRAGEDRHRDRRPARRRGRGRPSACRAADRRRSCRLRRRP